MTSKYISFTRQLPLRDRLTEQDPATQAVLKIYETIGGQGMWQSQSQVDALLAIVREAIAQSINEYPEAPSSAVNVNLEGANNE